MRLKIGDISSDEVNKKGDREKNENKTNQGIIWV
jgi:hypothetical protein